MKYFKLFENFENYTFVGYHCSPKEINDDFYGEIKEDYFTSFIFILDKIKEDFPKADKYIKKINAVGDDFHPFGDEMDLISDIQMFFNENDLEWIYVSKNEPLRKYGDNCYKVYFDNFEGVYSMVDELIDDADVYIYDTKVNRPILKPIY